MFRVTDKWKARIQTLTTGGVASTFFNIFEGRCTFAAICFSVAGVYGAVQGLLVLHSWKEDVAEQKQVWHPSTKEDNQ